MLTAFSVTGFGRQIHVIGFIDMAVAGSEMTEKRGEMTRDATVFSLVKNSRGWGLADQVCDVVEDIPSACLLVGLRYSGDER